MAKPEKPLLLNGQPLELPGSGIRPSCVKLAEFLDTQSDEELFSPDELSQRAKIGTCSIFDFTKVSKFAAYFYKSGGRAKLYFGNPRAIERLKALITEQGK